MQLLFATFFFKQLNFIISKTVVYFCQTCIKTKYDESSIFYFKLDKYFISNNGFTRIFVMIFFVRNTYHVIIKIMYTFIVNTVVLGKYFYLAICKIFMTSLESIK